MTNLRIGYFLFILPSSLQPSMEDAAGHTRSICKAQVRTGVCEAQVRTGI